MNIENDHIPELNQSYMRIFWEKPVNVVNVSVCIQISVQRVGNDF